MERDTPPVREVAPAEAFEHAAPGGIGERGKGAVEVGGETLNHLVQC